jgi:hypothetical protein
MSVAAIKGPRLVGNVFWQVLVETGVVGAAGQKHLDGARVHGRDARAEHEAGQEQARGEQHVHAPGAEQARKADRHEAPQPVPARTALGIQQTVRARHQIV